MRRRTPTRISPGFTRALDQARGRAGADGTGKSIVNAMVSKRIHKLLALGDLGG